MEEVDTTTGSLFTQIKPKDSEKLQEREVLSGLLIHPLKIPCHMNDPVKKLSKEENTFVDSFPSVRRFSGFLPILFGYESKQVRTPVEAFPTPAALKPNGNKDKENKIQNTDNGGVSGKSGNDVDVKVDLDYPLFLETKARWKPKWQCWCNYLSCIFCYRKIVKGIFSICQTIGRFLCPELRIVYPAEVNNSCCK